MLKYDIDISPASYTRSPIAQDRAENYPFRLISYGYFEARANYYTIRDGYPTYLLIYTVAGAGEMLWRGKREALGAGDAVLINCLERQEYRTLEGGWWRFYFLHVDGPGAQAYAASITDSLRAIRPRDQDAFLSAIASLERVSPDSEGALAFAEISHILSGLMLELVRARHAQEPPHPRRADILRAASYIRSCAAQNPSLNELARVSNLSKYYFLRLFTSQMGATPHRYALNVRLARAREMLVNTQRPVAEIGEACGFNDSAGFISAFRRASGLTPGEYRRVNLKGSLSFGEK